MPNRQPSSLFVTIGLSALVSTIIMLSGYALLRADGVPKWQNTISFAGTLSGTTRQNVQLKFTFYKGGTKCGEFVGKASFLVDDSFKSDIDLTDLGLKPCMPLFDGASDVTYDVDVMDTPGLVLHLAGQTVFGVPFALHAATADRAALADTASVAATARALAPSGSGWSQAGADRYIFTKFWDNEKNPGAIPLCLNGVTKVDIGGPFTTTRDLLWAGTIYVAGRDGGEAWKVQLQMYGHLLGWTPLGSAPHTEAIGGLAAPMLEQENVVNSNKLWVDIPCTQQILQLTIFVDSYVRWRLLQP